jgi:chromosome segregation ATPase
MKSITSRLTSQSQSAQVHEERLLRMRELASKLQQELTEKKTKEIDPLLRISKDQESRIQRIQDEIVNKVKERRDNVQVFQGQSEEIARRFETFFAKQAKTESTLKDLEHAKAEMKEELQDLIRKAKAFDLAAKGADTNAHIKELQGSFNTFDAKRGAFAKQLETLKSLILGKEEAVEKKAKTKDAKSEEKSAKKEAKKTDAKPVKKAVKKKK